MGARGAVWVGSSLLALDDVRMVAQGAHDNPGHPTRLTVTFRNGQTTTFNCPSAEDREAGLLALAGALAGPPEFVPLGDGHVRLSEVAAVEKWGHPGGGRPFAAEPTFGARARSRAGAVIRDAQFATEEERDAAYEALLGLIGAAP